MDNYPWWVTAIFMTLLIGACMSVLWAFYSGEWRWLLISLVSIIAIMNS